MTDTMLIVTQEHHNDGTFLRLVEEENQYTPAVCHSTTDAKHVLGADRENVKLLVVDFEGSVERGIQTVKELHEYTPDIPLIALVKEAMIREAAAALQAGATDFLMRPVSRERLQTTLGDLDRPRAAIPSRLTEQGNSVYFLHESYRTSSQAQEASSPKYERLPSTLSLLDENGDLRPLQELENAIILFSLQHLSGHMSETARKLGIGRSTLYRKLSDITASKKRIAS